jgi:hypothetical protein
MSHPRPVVDLAIQPGTVCLNRWITLLLKPQKLFPGEPSGSRLMVTKKPFGLTITQLVHSQRALNNPVMNDFFVVVEALYIFEHAALWLLSNLIILI